MKLLAADALFSLTVILDVLLTRLTQRATVFGVKRLSLWVLSISLM
jgi:hypothetical protein